MPVEHIVRNGKRLVRITEPKPPLLTPVTPEYLEECRRRDQEEKRERRRKERNETYLERMLRQQRKAAWELRYYGEIARGQLEQGVSRNRLPKHLLQGLEHLEIVEEMSARTAEYSSRFESVPEDGSGDAESDLEISDGGISNASPNITPGNANVE
ncbi:hypothetical protein VNI00_005591 [Paramarasmius palmivorus]|uniref:Uncharacterized protein n=1 Tax=Paramarasmius palmivorus TaxID=297713 RepID=A0AAW0DE71_9AGAR